MTISVTSPTTWTAGSTAHSSRAHHPNHGGTPFDQQLQMPQSSQSTTQASATAGSTSPIAAGASLATDMIRMIASHIDSAVGAVAHTG